MNTSVTRDNTNGRAISRFELSTKNCGLSRTVVFPSAFNTANTIEAKPISGIDHCPAIKIASATNPRP